MLSKMYSLGNILGIMDSQSTGGAKKCFAEEAEETQF